MDQLEEACAELRRNMERDRAMYESIRRQYGRTEEAWPFLRYLAGCIVSVEFQLKEIKEECHGR